MGKAPANLREQDRPGNAKQNTTTKATNRMIGDTTRNTADTNRHHGGPGSSQQNADDKPVDDPKNQPSG